MKIKIIPLITPKAPNDPFREIVHENPTKLRKIFRKVIAERFGSIFTRGNRDLVDVVVRTLLLSLVQGLSIAALIWFTLHMGCVLNPAVCLAQVCSYRLGLLNALGLIVVELCGAMVGAALLKWAIPNPYEKTLGATTLSPGTNVGHGILLELMGTFFLSVTVLATAVHNEGDPDIIRVAPWAIGCAVFAGVATLNPFTGGSMNPARSFGPAVVKGIWSKHYVYWIGPMLGGFFAGILFRFILAERVSYRYIERDDIQQEKSSVMGSVADKQNTEGKPTGDNIEESDSENLNLANDPYGYSRA
ncbi:hypothetical protein PPL_04158 [Heterostelium album PN500]|uniref:Aquaporin n=1 Tax=Heterostelium pallidum (strain ATCC 26659 / Pp 5 / PN500) TaxID=670386 RepID=D3B667_HETP5|nr:hypothetical protein PPL_04158 [Heterostelium album PN500]EFA83365.1 hypothetical protein PPL_04158 [Heterostelium album PN500]|eukprot:XP_020435482.1 hypothetical protein PPL_04158 [Heterostelium album PN500]